MNINVEVLFNDEKRTYTILNLDTGKKSSLQYSSGNSITTVFPGVLKVFNTRDEITSYVNEVKKQLKGKNA